MKLSQLPWLLLGLTAQRRTVRGFDVRVAGTEREAELVARQVAAAIEVIDTYDRATADDARSRVRWLLFTETSGGSYLEGIRSIRLGIEYAQRVAPLDLAMTMIHELTHAKMSEAGTRYTGPSREPIERACVAAEIGFARLVPDSDAAIERTQALLATEWWRPENAAPRSERELIDRGVPSWVARLLGRWSERRAQ
jgi:hypothetical protein